MKKDKDVSPEKDKIIDNKKNTILGHTSESPTVEEPDSNSKGTMKKSPFTSSERYFEPTTVTLGSPITVSSGIPTATIDNLAFQPVYFKTTAGQHMFPQNIVVGLDEERPVSYDEGLAFNSGFDTGFSTVASRTIDEQLRLRNEINELNARYIEKLKEVHSLKVDSKEKGLKIKELENDRQKILKNVNLNHLISRVNEEARKKLFDSEEFKNLFEMGNTCQVVVMAIDIRRSTEMMLKAKNERLYAEFITSLCQELCEIILINYGVFDKFTGDGILAFFPDFYSGAEAIYYALKAAEDCHELFNIHYKNNRHCFTTVLNEVGLGIGIDYGKAYLANVNNDLTIVGSPVVYACRMSGAKYGETLLNQPAFELLNEKYPNFCEFTETELELKHEGRTLAYKVKFNHKPLDISPPNWDALIEEFTKKLRNSHVA